MLRISSHALEPSSSYPYFVTAKRYQSPSPSNDDNDPNALTLILAHAIGMYKECFEPFLERLFELSSNTSDRKPGAIKIREAWSIDCITHGEAAALNEKLLPESFAETFEWDEYGRAIGHFLSAGESRGAEVDFSTRNLWGVGHSLGGISLIWLEASPAFPSITFQSLMIIEPVMQPLGTNIDITKTTSKIFLPGAYTRRDVWPSKRAALKDLSSNKVFQQWDRRALSLYVDYALRPHPAANFSFMPFPGVMLACNRMHEAAIYRGAESLTYSLIDHMNKALWTISKRIPVHIMWGEMDDTIPRAVQDALADKSTSLINFASVTRVQNAGHLVVQHNPDGAAEATFAALRLQSGPAFVHSRL